MVASNGFVVDEIVDIDKVVEVDEEINMLVDVVVKFVVDEVVKTLFIWKVQNVELSILGEMGLQ